MEIVKGRKYRVSFEATARGNVRRAAHWPNSLSGTFPEATRENTTVEDITPEDPFKSGDIVRHRASESVYVMAGDDLVKVKMGNEDFQQPVGYVYKDLARLVSHVSYDRVDLPL